MFFISNNNDTYTYVGPALVLDWLRIPFHELKMISTFVHSFENKINNIDTD